MNRKKQYTIIIITAILVFGALSFAKGKMYKHHQQHNLKHYEHCQSDDNK